MGYPGVDGEPREKETVCHTDPEAVRVWHVPPWNQPGQISPTTRVRSAHMLRQLTVISIGQETLTIRWSGMIETNQRCLKMVLFWGLNWEEMVRWNEICWGQAFFPFYHKISLTHLQKIRLKFKTHTHTWSQYKTLLSQQVYELWQFQWQHPLVMHVCSLRIGWNGQWGLFLLQVSRSSTRAAGGERHPVQIWSLWEHRTVKRTAINIPCDSVNRLENTVNAVCKWLLQMENVTSSCIFLSELK